MSGFRKFRSNTQRRRRSIEAAELGHLAGSLTRDLAGGAVRLMSGQDPDSHRDIQEAAGQPPHGDLPASREAVEIGPAPIAWLRPKRAEADN